VHGNFTATDEQNFFIIYPDIDRQKHLHNMAVTWIIAEASRNER
jgi:hypothetical protein